MSRDLSPEMEAHLAGTTHRRVWMIRLDLVDGTVIGLTTNIVAAFENEHLLDRLS